MAEQEVPTKSEDSRFSWIGAKVSASLTIDTETFQRFLQTENR